MPDITMCHGEMNGVVCQKRESCYRYTANPTPEWQSYFVDLPILDKNTPPGVCPVYWKNKQYQNPLNEIMDIFKKAGMKI